MKVKISISIGEETLKQITQKTDFSRFRNKSHFVEYAVTKLLREYDSHNS